MRDFYDIYLLFKLRRDEIDSPTLAAALTATSQKRDSRAALDTAGEILSDIGNNADLEVLWNNYSKKYNYTRDVP